MPRLAAKPAIDFPRDGETLDVAVARIGARLAESLQSVLDRLPGAPLRPQELARVLGINKDLSSRVIKALELKDPIAFAHSIPGPEPLRRILNVAGSEVDGEILDAANEAVQEFDALIRSVAGDRSGLDNIISAWLPDAREKTELLSKQAVFKGMSQIRGFSAELDTTTFLVHQSNQRSDKLDVVTLGASFGLRRLRPGADIYCTTIEMSESNAPPLRSLDDEPVTHAAHLMLEQFCTSPTPQFGVTEVGNQTHFTLLGDDVGLLASVDLAFASTRRICRDSNVRAGYASLTQTPVRMYILDVLLHMDVYPGVEPALAIYDTTVNGVANYWDPTRDKDRLDLKAGIDFLGKGVAGLRVAQIPNYVDMLRYVCERLDWDPQTFRCYRCAIEYPVYGSQIDMVFDPATVKT